MTAPVSLLLAAAMVVSAASAKADVGGVLVDGFLRYCAAQQGDPDAVKAMASRDGWALSPSSPPIPDFESSSMLVKTLDDQSRVSLVVGQGHHQIGATAVGGNICVLGGKAHDGAAIAKAVSDWAGVPPSPQNDPSTKMYVFEDRPEGHRAVVNADDASARKLVSDGKIALVMSGANSLGVTMIAYFHSKKMSPDVHPH